MAAILLAVHQGPAPGGAFYLRYLKVEGASNFKSQLSSFPSLGFCEDGILPSLNIQENKNGHDDKSVQGSKIQLEDGT